MISAWLLAAAMTTGISDESAKAAVDRSTYEAAAVAAGRDAGAHVDLALWCEAHGMAAEKARHLARAVLLNPEDARARGLLGHVKRDGRWMRPADAVRAIEESSEQRAVLDEYLDRRARARDRADDQYKLALWCEENGLKEPMTAHLRRTIQLDPGREGAWRRLGYKKSGGRWVDPEAVAAFKAEREARVRADKEWSPRLEKIRDGLDSRNGEKRAEAAETLAAIEDPRAVPSIWNVFARGAVESRQRISAEVFGRIEGVEASAALATLAVFSPHAAVRADATSLLRRRDPREFAGLLASFLRDEIKYKVKPVQGPGSSGELFVEGKDANVRRRYTPAPMLDPNLRNFPVDSSGNIVLSSLVGYSAMSGPISMADIAARRQTNDSPTLRALASANPAMGELLKRSTTAPGDVGISRDAVYRPWDAFFLPQQLSQELARDSSFSNIERLGGPNVRAVGITDFATTYIPIGRMIAEARASAMVAQSQISDDVKSIEAYNAPIRETNERAAVVLKDVGEGADFGTDPRKWADWAFELEGRGYALQNALSSQPTPTIIEEVPIAFQPQAAPYVEFSRTVQGYVPSGASCFAGGTPVRTLQGDRPIESIRPGDMVLSQDVATGEFRYRAVATAFHNPPNWTYAVDLGGDVVHPTGIHRFWKAGRGWVMARDLKPGDRLRTVGGAAEVVSVEKEDMQPVFNLLLADGESYCVGSIGLIAHDNSLPAPVAKPFDGVPATTKLAAATKP